MQVIGASGKTFKKCVRLRVCVPCVRVCVTQNALGCPGISYPDFSWGQAKSCAPLSAAEKLNSSSRLQKRAGQRMRVEKKVRTVCTHSLGKLSWANSTVCVSCSRSLCPFSLCFSLWPSHMTEMSVVNNFRCLMNFN